MVYGTGVLYRSRGCNVWDLCALVPEISCQGSHCDRMIYRMRTLGNLGSVCSLISKHRWMASAVSGDFSTL